MISTNELDPIDSTESFDDMIERLRRTKVRKGYYAVPLVDTGRHPDAPPDTPPGMDNYQTYSAERIKIEFEEAFSDAVNRGWIKSGADLRATLDSPETKRLHDGLKHLSFYSVTDSHRMRIERNSARNVDDLADPSDPDVIFAKEGLSSPEELAELLKRYPQFINLELAKDSHLFKFSGCEEMDLDIARMFDNGVFQDLDVQSPIYTRKFEDSNIPALVVERKTTIGRCETSHGEIHLVHRSRLLVRGDEYAVGLDKGLGRGVKNANRFPELAAKIHHDLPYAEDGNEDYRWLQPISSSYYAFYVDLWNEAKNARAKNWNSPLQSLADDGHLQFIDESSPPVIRWSP